jgi:hypothetical protein
MRLFRRLPRLRSEAPMPTASLTLPEGERTSTLTPLPQDGKPHPRIMITNGGPHPPVLWAQATAEHLVQIPPSLTGARRSAALELQLAVAAALEPHHARVQETERSKLAADHKHLLTELDGGPHLDAAVAAIQGAARGTEWEAHFADSERVQVIRHELGVHFRTAQHIERSWHCDRNPAHPAAQAYRRLRHPGTGA